MFVSAPLIRWRCSPAVCSWLCAVALAMPAGADWMMPACCKSFNASFRRPACASAAVASFLAVWAALLRLLARDRACSSWAMASSISRVLPWAPFWASALRNKPLPALTAPQLSLLSSNPSPLSPRLSLSLLTMWPRLSWLLP